MLKALELVGFKSFADKTRFEFPPGITVVVGPNGSGKSNIVDAIKWVLGEQSVKSLRGKEMADVIFNGSGSRRAQNSADCVLTFDNQDKLLPIDTPEVHVGRRVYRSGEGEYLINGQACRLRDIRDLLAGTGVSTQAYSIIEQGKVDIMLQASPRDRRLIFEEAAGISRFKVKKVEALRRLERVDQNLLRLSDIVDEVENRLKTVRKQAGKASRYKQYTDRLQELRTQVGLTDWRRLTEQLTAYTAQLDELRTRSVQLSARAETLETQALQREQQISELDETIRLAEQTVSANRERIAGCESSMEHQRRRRDEFEQEIERRRNQLTAMSSRTRDLDSQLETTAEEVAAAQLEQQQVRQARARAEQTLQELADRYDQLRRQIADRRATHMDSLGKASRLASELTSLETRIQTAGSAFTRCGQMLARLQETRNELNGQLAGVQAEDKEISRQLDDVQRENDTARRQLAQSQTELAEAQQQLQELREQQSRVGERALVLEELEKSFEGLSSGVKEVMVAARTAADGPFREIRGLVADVLEVQVEMAPLIDAALGERSGHLVAARGNSLRQLLESGKHTFGGRVGFLPLEAPADRRQPADLENHEGVIGRADHFVRSETEFEPLVRRLLSCTWIVERIRDALALAAVSEGQQFVTRDGETVDADGTICVGPKQSASGLIMRRSELRELRQQLVGLSQQVDTQVGIVDRLSDQVADANARLESLSEQRESLQRLATDCHRRLSAAEERETQLADKHATLTAELDLARGDRDAATSDLALVRDRRNSLQQQLTDLEKQIEADQHALDQVDQQRQAQAADAGAAEVDLAKAEQHLDHLATRMQQFQHDHEERQRTIDEGQSQLEEATGREVECRRKILELESETAELYVAKESLGTETVRQQEAREALRQQRGQLHVDAQKVRAEARKIDTEVHQVDLDNGQVRHERDTLAGRMREDYGIELAELTQDRGESEEEQHQRKSIEEEISDLRRKINNIGNVNLDALEELEGLDQRFAELSQQFEDLSAAKKSLESIIEKINADSRRLFTETLQTVRGHFQTLFRKLFGGGQADIVVDEETDILDSGLEIVARPPGKEPRSISLLSGGEKTLTCVALLLAIFRSRPSPFCVLDEVDAALDEANIERFIGVLQEFLAWTQFIVVTHSKKTMTCAGTLYGVTMQESGISKRVSVRFEDVSETGEILRTSDDDEDGTQAA